MSKPTLPDAWKQAVIDYTNALSPAQQLKFKAPATVDDCLCILRENRSRKKAFTRILQFFEPLIETLKCLEGVINVVVQINAGIESPIWGPLRLAITIASNHFKTLERLTFIIDKISSSIKRYHDFETLFHSHDDVRNAIGALYSDLICFCTRLVRFHTKYFRHPFVSFDKEFGSISESIDFHSEDVHRAAYVAHMKEEKDAREKMESDRQTENLHRLQCWLSPSTVEDDLQKHLKEYMSGSYDWVLSTTELSSWLHGHSNDTLQIVGRPGSGKSTLAAFLIQHLSKTSSAVLYFFCDDSDGEKRETIYVLRTLLAQLLKVNPSAQNRLLPLYHQSGRLFADSSHVISQAFRMAMGNLHDHDIYLVIDAVDECRDGGNYDGLLFQLQSATKDTKTKVVLTTRLQTFPSAEYPATFEVTMKPELCLHHIHEYVKRRVQKLRSIVNADLANQVIEQIVQSSDGLWLYARLMVDEVERAPSKERVLQCLKSLPRGLSELYNQVLRSCEGRMTDDQREFAKYLYVWLDVHNYMPFFRGDFDCLPYRMLQLIFRFVNDGNEVFDAVALARELGAPLIEVHPIDSTYELQFVHRTAYQFLTDSSGLPSYELPVILKPQRLKQLHRGVTAVWYFTECSDSANQLEYLKDPSREFFRSNPMGSYFEMAYGLWNAFNLTCLPKDPSQEEKEEVKMMSRQLTDFIRSGKCLRHFEMATIINYSGDYILLRDLVLKALHSAQYPIHGESITDFEEFRKHVEGFLIAWAYVLHETTPWPIWPTVSKPSFDENQNVVAMMQIAKRWGDIFFPAVTM